MVNIRNLVTADVRNFEIAQMDDIEHFNEFDASLSDKETERKVVSYMLLIRRYSITFNGHL